MGDELVHLDVLLGVALTGQECLQLFIQLIAFSFEFFETLDLGLEHLDVDFLTKSRFLG